MKGIAEDIIEAVIARFKEDFNEYDMARQLVEARCRLVRGIGEDKARYRLYSYLKRRGFSDTVIYKVLDESYTYTR